MMSSTANNGASKSRSGGGVTTDSINADAEDYVESVMSSQRISRVATPAVSNRNRRKRNASDPSDSTVKKARTVTDNADKVCRSLYSPDCPRRVVVAEADVHVDGNPSVQHLIAKLSADMHMLFCSLQERMDKLESGLEQRISKKVSQLLDKRVNSELNKIHKDVDDRLDIFKGQLRSEVSEDLDVINEKLSNLNVRPTNSPDSNTDIARNLVIRGLPETANENVSRK